MNDHHNITVEPSDLQDLFRVPVDLVAAILLENGVMEGKDFIRTEDYNPGLKPAGARKPANEFSSVLKKSKLAAKRSHMELCYFSEGKRLSSLPYL